MVDQLPNLGREQEMLSAMGMSSIDDLFSDIPEEVRMTATLPLPAPQSEEEILADARRLLGANVPLSERVSFLGAGLYQNFVPSAVFQLVNRGEFLTAYTPYQPEVSQGMLQAMWEYQSMICDLTALPVSNVSVYDASTAAAEAITCAVRVHNRKASQKNTVWVSELLPPEKMSVIHNYCQGGSIILKTLLHTADGHVDIASAQSAAGSCGIYVEQPNCLGILDEGICGLKEIIGADTALIIAVQPTSLGLIEAPGNYGADIVVGEGQPLGSPLTFGGPIYGIFACTDKYLRQMPGRIVGRSIDGEGREAYCLTLSTREQHIRRHRATSNICTNETLIALMGAIHISMLGPEGMRDLAIRNMAACQVTKQRLAAIQGIAITHGEASHYNEFSITLPSKASEALFYLDQKGIIGGHDLGRWFGSRENELLICATDQTSAADIDALAKGLESWLEVVS